MTSVNDLHTLREGHPMKIVLIFSMLFCMSVLSAFAELTDADLDKIRLIVNEEIKAEITTLRGELKAEIATVERGLKAEIANSEKNMKEHIKLSIQSVEKQLTTYNWVIYVLTPLIVAAIGIPTTIMAWRGAA